MLMSKGYSLMAARMPGSTVIHRRHQCARITARTSAEAAPRARFSTPTQQRPLLPLPSFLSRPAIEAAPTTAEDQSKRNVLALIGLTSAVSFICSIDRAAMSVAILPMSHEFAWDDGVKGTVSAAFFIGYTVTNILGGVLATRFSAKAVLGAGVVMWSLFTMATPVAAAGNLSELLMARALMGVGEGVAYPSVQNIVRDSVSDTHRSRALSFIYSGHQLGTIASYLIAPILISELGWESVFYIFGSLGLVWLIFWSPLLASEKAAKEEAQAAKAAETSLGAFASNIKALFVPSTKDGATANSTDSSLRFQDVPWREFAASKAFWAIVAAQVSVGVGSCLAFSWLPTYYSEVYHLDVASSAAFCLVPFIATVLTTNAAGWIADSMVNNKVLTKTQTRKLMQLVASLGPAACLLRLAAQPEGGSAFDAVTLVSAWLALGGFSAAGYGSNHQDISSKWAGVMFGLSNGLASVAGSASIFATGLVLHQTNSDWGLIFSGAAGVYILGAGVYLKWASAEQQFE